MRRRLEKLIECGMSGLHDLLRPSLLPDRETRLQNKEVTFPGIGSFMVEPGLLSLMNVLSAPPFL